MIFVQHEVPTEVAGGDSSLLGYAMSADNF